MPEAIEGLNRLLVTQRFQLLFQRGTQMRMLGRQLQRLAEMGGILVAVETGFVGGHLEQHAAWCAEVDRPEVVAVYDGGYLVTRIHQLLAHLQLLFAVFDRKRDVVHGTGTEPCTRYVRHCFDIDDIGAVTAGHTETQHAVLTIHFLVTHEFQQFGGRALVAKPQRSTLKTVDRLIFADTIAGPLGAGIIPDLDQRKTVAVWPGEMQALVAESFVRFQTIDAGPGKTVLPVTERPFRHRKQRRPHLPGAGAAAGNMREREIGHDGAGRADFIAIIEMIDIGRVKIHRLLHPAQAERIGEKTVVLARACRH
ncbi:hypothetical protein AT6N2_C3144 [Agrobacterium tumefaciens]|nr:hypothetical protein AT6N2_C3144 [Agrobacterium tumefaciens]